MTLFELYTRIGSILEMNNHNERIKNTKVVVLTQERSVGCRASSDVKNINLGFDWDSGKVFISTEDKLVKLK